MKFFKFNLTPMVVILHIMAIFVNLGCYHVTMNMLWNRTMTKLAYLAGYWLDLAQSWCEGGGVFLDSKSKINNKDFI